jgi:hypothetical protein
MGRQGVIVPVGKTIAAIFTPDHRPVTPDFLGDLGVAEPSMQTPVDLHALLKTEPMSPASRPRQISRMR